MAPSRTPPGTFAAYRLPGGRHRLPPEVVAESQRWRLLGAAAEVLAQRGYAKTTSADVATCAGVSASTFYTHFESFPDCLRAAYEMTGECIWGVVSGPCQAEGLEWSRRLRIAIDDALDFLASEPTLAQLLGAEAPAGVPAIAAARSALIAKLAELLASGRAQRPPTAPELPSATEQRLIGATFALVSGRLRAGGAERLPELAPELAEMLAAPYTGSLAEAS